MSKENDEVEVLIERNYQQQMTGFDWDGLYAGISLRIDDAEEHKPRRINCGTLVRIGAGALAAAAVLLFCIMLNIDRAKLKKPQIRGRAVVEFAEASGTGSVEINPLVDGGRAIVEIGRSKKETAVCDLKIIDLQRSSEEAKNEAAWMIIKVLKDIVADNGAGRDEIDLICLL